MTIYVGTAGRVHDVSGSIAGVKNWSIDTGVSELDGSNFGSTWRLGDSGIKEWSGSFEGNYDDTNAGQNRLWNAMVNGTNLTIYLYMSLAPVKYFTGDVKLTGFSPNQAFDNLGSGSWQVKGTSPLTTVT